MTAPAGTPARDPLRLLASIRERAEAATPGPWEHPLDHEVTRGYHMKRGRHVATWIANCDAGDEDITDEQANANAEFIANARSDIPRLLDACGKVLMLCDSMDERARAEFGNLCPVDYRATAIRLAIAAALSGSETPS